MQSFSCGAGIPARPKSFYSGTENLDLHLLSVESYQEYLISALQDPARAAGNIEVALEVEDFDLEVLKVTISDVVEAYSKVDSQSDILKQKHKELESIITNSKGVEIFALIDLLNTLGFKLTLGLKD